MVAPETLGLDPPYIPSASSQLDHETTRFLAQLHRAWSDRASSSAYAQLRDELLLQRDKVDTRVAALSTVARIACPDELSVDGDWQELFALASSIEDEGKKRKREYHKANRLRNYLIVAALWSPSVLVHYGWDKVGQTQMYTLRTCATRYPCFIDDLCPRLNAVLLERHRQGINIGCVKTLNEAAIQISRDLTPSALASVTPHGGEEEPWLTDESGSFPLATGGPSLCQLRPYHYRSYLLAKDCFGVLVARDPGLFQRNQQQQSLETDPPPMDAIYVQQSTSPCGEPASTVPSSPTSTDPSAPPSTDPSAPESTLLSTPTTLGLFDSLVENHCPVDWYSHEYLVTPVQTQVLTLESYPDPPMAASPGISSILSNGHVPTPGEHSQFQDVWTRHTCDFSPLQLSDTSSELSDLSRDGSPSQVDVVAVRTHTSCAPGRQTRSGSETTLEFDRDDDSCTDVDTDDSGSRTTAYSSSRSSWVSKKRRRLEAKAARPTTGILKPARSGQAKRPRSYSTTLPNCAVVVPPLTMEETLQSRYRDLVESHVANVAEEACRPETSHQREIRAQWFNATTTWASIWTRPQGGLPRGEAPTADQAEVLYYTSDEFIRAAQNNQIFNKPIVIKEHFMDSGMHTIDGLTSALDDAPSGAVIEVGSLDSPRPVRMPIGEFVTGIRTNRLDSVHTLNLRNITHCHQPLFTMLPRFRLLQTLVERAEDSTLGGRIVSSTADVGGYTGFNSLELAGAFSGPRLDSFRGTWLRNLAGVKLCAIVPQESMESEWHGFIQHGQEWAPNERQRLILLERDDVLLLPPGLRVVHAMHSPTDSLAEVGTFWDELDIVQTLDSLCWILKNQAISDKIIGTEIPHIIGELEKLVADQPDRFRGQSPKSDFLCRFKDAVLSLKELGCYCPQQD